MLVLSYLLIEDGDLLESRDPKPEQGWICDEFCTYDGYERMSMRMKIDQI